MKGGEIGLPKCVHGHLANSNMLTLLANSHKRPVEQSWDTIGHPGW